MNKPQNTIASTDRRDFLKVSLGLALTSTGSVSMMSSQKNLASANLASTTLLFPTVISFFSSFLFAITKK